MSDDQNPTAFSLLLEYFKRINITYYQFKASNGETCVMVDMGDGYHIVRTFSKEGELFRTYVSKIVSSRFDFDGTLQRE